MTSTSRDDELAKETQDVIRFLLSDNAFDREFLLTAVQEYYHNNRAAGHPFGEQGK